MEVIEGRLPLGNLPAQALAQTLLVFKDFQSALFGFLVAGPRMAGKVGQYDREILIFNVAESLS